MTSAVTGRTVYGVRDIDGQRVEVAGTHTPDDPCTPGIVVLGDANTTHTFTVAQAQSLAVRLLVAIRDALGEVPE
ncbi:hypothetical protein [Haloechinothrix salitolerans]|uniref:Uncharacterized protein n=1 Tax=Haloechinothrix salitolerans TaxID=926830 RepID=A0ABW2C7Z6_9PSEU